MEPAVKLPAGSTFPNFQGDDVDLSRHSSVLEHSTKAQQLDGGTMFLFGPGCLRLGTPVYRCIIHVSGPISPNGVLTADPVLPFHAFRTDSGTARQYRPNGRQSARFGQHYRNNDHHSNHLYGKRVMKARNLLVHHLVRLCPAVLAGWAGRCRPGRRDSGPVSDAVLLSPQSSREQLAIAEFAHSLLVIPKTLSNNAAQDSTELVAKMRGTYAARRSRDGRAASGRDGCRPDW